VISIVPKIFRFILYSELADTNCEGDYVENLMLFVKTANFIILKAPFFKFLRHFLDFTDVGPE
jgi:hypothetical protein